MTRIGVLTGGSTPERTVALAGAAKVVAALRQRDYDVTVFDSCQGRIPRLREAELLSGGVGKEPPGAQELADLAAREDLPALVGSGELHEQDVLFPVLHGRLGEGGELQALLSLAGLEYVGSDAVGGALAMDKEVSKRLLVQAGVPTPNWALWPATDEAIEALGLPLVVKPSRVGSTVGLSVVDELGELSAAVELAARFDDEILLESFIPGRELTVGILGQRALGVGEIIVPGRIFDFESKYTPGIAQEIFPASIDESLAEELRNMACRAHQALKLRDMSRVDFRLDLEGRIFCLEANTLPGMTETSLLPQSAAVFGIDFAELCHDLVERALERRDRRRLPTASAEL